MLTEKSTEVYMQYFVLERQESMYTYIFTFAKRNTEQIKTEASNNNNKNVICRSGQEQGEKVKKGNK